MKHSRTERSTEAPMDFQWTDRVSIKPVWASSSDLNTPRKRPHEDLRSTPSLGTSAEPTFGSNHNFPFLFQQPQVPHTSNAYPWSPPAQTSLSNPFLPPMTEEVKDVDMNDASPAKTEEVGKESSRFMALGGMKRVYNQRQKAMLRKKKEQDSESGDELDDDSSNTMTHNTSNHYTLNLSAPSVPQPDMSYVLLGYLQLFFNLSLILLFLYLVVQFILTVQRDVEQRISEYSMEIVQEISMCALQHRNNLCSTTSLPAMVQQCSNWEICMNRDPTVVGHAKVGAELIAEVVNGFVEPISWKTLIFILTSLSFLTVFINTLLSLYRARHQPVTVSSQNSHPAYDVPPHLPHHYGSFLPSPDTAWSLRRSAGPGAQNPTRRRRLEGVSVKHDP